MKKFISQQKIKVDGKEYTLFSAQNLYGLSFKKVIKVFKDSGAFYVPPMQKWIVTEDQKKKINAELNGLKELFKHEEEILKLSNK